MASVVKTFKCDIELNERIEKCIEKLKKEDVNCDFSKVTKMLWRKFLDEVDKKEVKRYYEPY